MTKKFIEDFYEKLRDEIGDENLDALREDLMIEETSDDEWKEYCYSSESPF